MVYTNTPRKDKESTSFIKPEIVFCTLVMKCASSFTGSSYNCCVSIMVNSDVNVLRSSKHTVDLYDLGVTQDSFFTWCFSDWLDFSGLTHYGVSEVAFSYNGACAYVNLAAEFFVSSLLLIMLIKILLY